MDNAKKITPPEINEQDTQKNKENQPHTTGHGSASSAAEKQEEIGQRAHKPHHERATASSDREKEDQMDAPIRNSNKGD